MGDVEQRAFKAALPSGDGYVILEEQPEGCYAFLFENGRNTRDDLFDNLGDAIEVCGSDYGIADDDWQKLDDHEFLMGGS